MIDAVSYIAASACFDFIWHKFGPRRTSIFLEFFLVRVSTVIFTHFSRLFDL